MRVSIRRSIVAVVLLMVCISAFPAFSAEPVAGESVDWDKARRLYQREQRGEALTGDDAAFLKHAKEVRQKNTAAGLTPEGRVPGRDATGLVVEPHDSVGLVPLTQLKGDAKYKGEDGGLYGGGRNDPPAEHLKAALAESAKIVPLGPDGRPAADGKIVLLSVGMSNTTQEFSRFKEIADADPAKSARVVVVDGAQGGKEGSAWSGRDPARGKGVWETVETRLTRAGVKPEQVQVLWIKQARANPAALGDYPKHAEQLDEDLINCLNLARRKWPNVRIAYLSSRIYAGYANSGLNPEPYAYEGALAVRSLIREQIKGNPKLNFDPAEGAVTSPLLLWGPYLWADGINGREADDLVWTRQDLGPDGTHPSPAGRQKVADLLLKFLKSDPTARPWFVGEGRP